MVPAADGAAMESIRVSLPDAGLANCEAPELTYRRSFNLPTGLESHSVVLLLSELLPLAQSVLLNGQLLPPDQAGQVEITPLLQPHNELLVTLQRDAYLAASRATASLRIIEPA